MGFFQDLKPAFQKHTLTFLHQHHEMGNIISFLFKCNEPLRWKAGQHGVLTFSRKLQGRSWRGFSIASSPEENVVRIATRITNTPSAYKKALSDMKPGDTITMRGPFGPFYLDNSRRPVVFIAGGIGVTPYRSMILHCAANKDQAPLSIRLLHADDAGQFAFRPELDAITAKNPFIRLDYISGSEMTARIIEFVREAGNNAQYYISGSGKMVRSLKKTLMQKGIEKKNIKYEMFLGL
jgi:ferredoxin-NADP reductase